MRYLSLDLETSGLDHEMHELLELGMADCRTDEEHPRHSLSVIIVHEHVMVDTYVAVMHKDLWEELQVAKEALGDKNTVWRGLHDNVNTQLHTYFCKPDYLYQVIEEWLAAIEYEGTWTVGGKNVAFDLDFLMKHCDFKVRHRRLDPMMLYIQHDDEKPPSLKQCLERAGYEDEVPHRAVEDAMLTHTLIYEGLRRNTGATSESS